MALNIQDLKDGKLVHSPTPLADVMNGKLGSSRTQRAKRARKSHGEFDERPKWENYGDDIDLEYDEGSYDSEGELLARKPPPPFKRDKESNAYLANFIGARKSKTVRVDTPRPQENLGKQRKLEKSVFGGFQRLEEPTAAHEENKRERVVRKRKERQEKEVQIEADGILKSMSFTMRATGTHNGFSKLVCTPGTETYRVLYERASRHRHNWKRYEPYGGGGEKPHCLSYEHTKIAPYLAKFSIGKEANTLVESIVQLCKDVLIPLPESTEKFQLYGNPFVAHSFWLTSNNGDYKFYIVFMESGGSARKELIFMDYFYLKLGGNI